MRVALGYPRAMKLNSGKRVAGAGLLVLVAGYSLWRSFTILTAPSLDLTCAAGRRTGMCEIGVWLLRLFDSNLHRPLLSAACVGLAGVTDLAGGVHGCGQS